jgi:hypothetical protein
MWTDLRTVITSTPEGRDTLILPALPADPAGLPEVVRRGVPARFAAATTGRCPLCLRLAQKPPKGATTKRRPDRCPIRSSTPIHAP